MQEKIKTYYQNYVDDYIDRLHDIRVLGLVTFVVIVLLISWSGMKAIDTNYGLQKQITQISQQNQLQNLTNNNLKLQNEYFNTTQYQELEARANFGLAMPGEKELIVPKSVALAHTTNVADEDAAQTAQTKAKQPTYQRHFQAWMNFFLHRQQTNVTSS